MKKKTRIIGSISALALSMAMLTGGVLAASQVSLNVSSTVSFNAQGVYLKAEGQVKRGANQGSLSNLTTSANYTYTGYSYNPDASGEPDGTSYTNTAMRDQAGSTAGWQIGEVEFTETEKVLQYAITFTNYSEFDVSITITPNVAATLTGITTSSTETQEIVVSAKSGETPGTASYTFTMTLTNFSTSVSGAVGLDISAERYVVQLYDVTISDGYYYALPGDENAKLSNGETFQHNGKILIIGCSYIYDQLDSYSLNTLIGDWESQPINELQNTYYSSGPETDTVSITVNNLLIDELTLTNNDGGGGILTMYIVLDVQENSNIVVTHTSNF